MKPLLDGLRAFGPIRLAAMGAVALAMFGLLAVVTLRGSSEHMSLLYGDLDMRDAGQVVEQLDRLKIPHQVGGAGNGILVPPDQVAQTRMLLAKEGLPSGGSIGYEIFDRGDGLTANQFQQTINQTRAMEGELARSIRLISGVRGARVHLVLPKREPFAREQQEAQASVLLTDDRLRAARPRGRAGDPQPGRRRGAGAQIAEHRHHRQPRRRAGARRPAIRPGRRGGDRR